MSELSTFDTILGESDAAAAIRAFAARAAAVDATVLLTGESGTGKGLLARAIHSASARSRAALVAVNCASVPETLFESEFFGFVRGAFTGAQQTHRGLLEQADRGTLFLDEIGELVLPLQAKLLTVIEDGEVRRLGAERAVRVNARLVAATGVDLAHAVAAHRFRSDLYHRLLVLSFRLPPLRERDNDVELFALHFLDRFTQRYNRPIRGFDSAALTRLRAHAWPGNIRQLANAIESAVLACDAPRIALRHLPESVRSGEPAPVADRPEGATGAPAMAAGRKPRYSHFGTNREEQRRIVEALRRCHGNKTRAAADLGMARNTLRSKLRLLDGDSAPGPQQVADNDFDSGTTRR
jgi:DNA-binding NtrC family response regulator